MCRIILLAWLACLVSTVSAEQYFSCTDEKGRKAFQSTPCVTGESAVVKVDVPVSTYKRLLHPEKKYMNDSHQICVKEWSKRGKVDKRMYQYCLGQQKNKYKELKELDRKYSRKSFYSETAYPYCVGEWEKRGVINTQMLVYCLNEEIEGVRDVNYYGKEYSDGIYHIVDKALARYGSWNMAAYEVKISLGL